MATTQKEDTSFNPNWEFHGDCCRNVWRRIEWGCLPPLKNPVVEEAPAEESAA